MLGISDAHPRFAQHRQPAPFFTPDSIGAHHRCQGQPNIFLLFQFRSLADL